MDKKRIAYLDFIKVLAMFIVTIGHCAQALSLQTFPDKLIPNDFFVTIHMPLFMIASGFVLNFDKIRDTLTKDYIYNKFTRLIIPFISWFLIYSIVTINIPSFNSFFYTYWYLLALFFSLVIIKFFSSFIKSNLLLIITTLLFVLIIPITRISHINFMFPFLIYGYLLKKFIDRLNFVYFIPLGILFVILYICYWGITFTVYKAPLDVLNLDSNMLYSFMLRLIIGIVGSTFVFLLVKRYNNTPFVEKIAKYGKYTLVFYTMTTVINGFTNRFLSFIDYNITNPYLLDVASIIFAMLQMFIIYWFAKLVEKKKMLSKLLLGD